MESHSNHTTPPPPGDEDKKSLPSIFTDFDDLGPRRASLPSLGRTPSYGGGGGGRAYALASYTFPPTTEESPYSASSYESLPSDGGGGGQQAPSAADWMSPIVRPSSTPLRHASFSSTLRISGRKDGSGAGWPYPSPHHHHPQHPQHLPQEDQSPLPPPLPSPPPIADRPQRKRGKLPKETTDFLKAWLHRHSDHPYPSEDEKKQLCHATGLSMSQVSNWMINARRRILAPARPTSGPTTTAPFPQTQLGGGGVGGMGGGGVGRRTSLPVMVGGHVNDPTLQLYHPMSLQTYGHGQRGSLPGGGGGGGYYSAGAASSYSFPGEGGYGGGGGGYGQ